MYSFYVYNGLIMIMEYIRFEKKTAENSFSLCKSDNLINFMKYRKYDYSLELQKSPLSPKLKFLFSP